MIRYINIGDQIEEGANQFAFFNTVDDSFITLEGQQVFYNITDLKLAAAGTGWYDRLLALAEANRKS